jgi:hypothetical protein
MITYRDYVVDEYRRQEMMHGAAQRRLVQSILADGNPVPSYWRRCLGRLGELLVALGRRIQTQKISPDPTTVIR